MTPLRTNSSETMPFSCCASISMFRSTQSQPMIRSGSPTSLWIRAVAHDIDAFRNGQHEPFIDGAEEGQAVIGIDLLDGTHVIEAADPDHQRMGGEDPRRQLFAGKPDHAR